MLLAKIPEKNATLNLSPILGIMQGKKINGAALNANTKNTNLETFLYSTTFISGLFSSKAANTGLNSSNTATIAVVEANNKYHPSNTIRL